MARATALQRQFDEGALVLLDVRPASASERAWTVLVRHVRDRVPYAVLAVELGLSQRTVQRLAERAAAALWYPDLDDLPSASRRALVLAGYTSREAVAQASDEALLRLNRMSTARLRAIREVIPRAE